MCFRGQVPAAGFSTLGLKVPPPLKPQDYQICREAESFSYSTIEENSTCEAKGTSVWQIPGCGFELMPADLQPLETRLFP